VYRRHTNFAIESIEQTFNGSADFGKKVSVTVSRNGDLIHKVYLEAVLSAMSSGSTVAWARKIGNTMIDEVSIEIGGQQIDRHYGLWLNLWDELTTTAEHQDTYNAMVGDVTAMNDTSGNSTPQYTVYVPLQFWFCRHPGLALPLIALQ